MQSPNCKCLIVYRIVVLILFQFPFFTKAQPFPPGRLIAHYPFAGDAKDISGNQHDGIVNGATLTIDNIGNENGAYYFDGSDTILIDNHPDFDFIDFDFVNRVTISAWFKPINSSGEFLITKLANSSIAGPYTMDFSTGFPRILLCNDSGDAIVDLAGTSHIQEGVWQHMAFTFDGDQVNLYYNGQLEASQSSSRPLQQSDGVLYFGYSPLDNQYYEGAMDDIYFYNYALTDSEISDLYNANVVTGLPKKGVNNFTGFSIDNEHEIDLKVYPNPFDRVINVEFSILREKSDLTIIIIDQQNRILNTIPMKSLKNGLHSLHMSRDEIIGRNAASGLYMLCLQFDDLLIRKYVILK